MSIRPPLILLPEKHVNISLTLPHVYALQIADPFADYFTVKLGGIYLANSPLPVPYGP